MSAKYVLILNLFSATLLFFRPSPAAASQSIHLDWLASPSSEVVGYNIYYGTKSGVYSTTLSGGLATQLEVTNLQDGLKYYFVVTARDNAGQESEPSNEASYGVAGIAPPDGAPFIQQILPDHAVTLGWNPSHSPAIEGYYVYYGTQSGFYDKIVWVENASAVDIRELADGVTYYFTVTATNSFGQESIRTPEISYTIPQLAPPQSGPTIRHILPDPDVLTMSWPASPSAGVAGYIVYYGTQSGVYDNWQYTGTVESLNAAGFVEGITYYFVVVAFDDFGQWSTPSAETAYFFGQAAVEPPGVMLSLQQTPVAGFPNTFAISAEGTVPPSWTVEGSPDLTSWYTLATGVETEVKVAVVVTEKPALFFRLKSWFAHQSLDIQTPQTNAFPNSFVVTTPDVVAWDWTLESTENLKNWSPLVLGSFSPVKVAIVNAAVPAMYFRLKGN